MAERFAKILILLWTLSVSAPVAGQDSADPKFVPLTPAERKIESLLVNHSKSAIHSLLNIYLPPRDYYLDIKTNLMKAGVDNQTGIPYLPGSASLIDPETMSLFELSNYAESIEVNIFIAVDAKIESTFVNEYLSAQLRSLIALEPKFNIERIVVGDTGKDQNVSLYEATQKLYLNENKLAEVNQDYKRLSNELKSTKQQLGESKAVAIDAIQKVEESGSADTRLWKIIVTTAFLGIFFVAVLFRLGTGIKTFATSVNEAIKSHAWAIENMGNAISQIATTNEKQFAASMLDNGSEDSLAHLAQIGARLSDLKTDILSILDDRHTEAVVNHIVKLTSQGQTSIAGGILELLPNHIATEVFAKLSDRHKQEVTTTLEDKATDKNKLERMLAGAESLYSLLVLSSISSDIDSGHVNLKMRLARSTNDEIFGLVKDLEPRGVLRLFCLLPSHRVVEILETLQREFPSSFAEIVESMRNLATMHDDESMDDELLSALDRQEVAITEDVEGAYLPFFQRVVEEAPEELSTALVASLSQSSRIGEFIRTKVIRFDTIFEVEPANVASLLGHLSMRDLAILLHTHEGEKKDRLIEGIDPLKAKLVQAEIESLETWTRDKLASEVSKVREEIRSALDQMRSDGTMKFRQAEDEFVVPDQKVA